MHDPMDSIGALTSFIEHWNDQLPKEHFRANGDASFPCRIKYSNDSGMTSGKAVVRFKRNSAEDGQVTIDSDDQFDPDEFLRFFTHTRHSYEFDQASGRLTISGPSKYGEVEVTIEPA